MVQSIKTIIFFIILTSTLIKGQQSCCIEDTFMFDNKRLCNDGISISLKCPKSFQFICENSEYTIDENGSLFLNSQIYPPDTYCIGNKSESLLNTSGQTMFMLCADPNEESINNFHINLITLLAIVSSIFYMITIASYVWVEEWRNLQGQCLLNAVIGSLICCSTLAGVNLNNSYISDISCHLIAYTIYFSSLYGFSWLNLLCFDIWRHVIEPKCLQSIRRWKLMYYLQGIGNPLIALSILMFIHHWNSPDLSHIHPGIGETSCWFKSIRETLMFYYIPISIMLFSNIVFFIWTTIKLWKPTKGYSNRKLLKYRLILFLKLFLIMGIFWSCEVISATMIHFNVTSSISWIFTDVVNALQGLITFLVLVLFRKKIMYALANKKLCGYELKFLKRWKHIKVSECESLQGTVINDVPMETHISD